VSAGSTSAGRRQHAARRRRHRWCRPAAGEHRPPRIAPRCWRATASLSNGGALLSLTSVDEVDPVRTLRTTTRSHCARSSASCDLRRSRRPSMSFRKSWNKTEMVLQLIVDNATVESVSISCAGHLLAKRARANLPARRHFPKVSFGCGPAPPFCLVLRTIGTRNKTTSSRVRQAP
jgi:hypothetical protein